MIIYALYKTEEIFSFGPQCLHTTDLLRSDETNSKTVVLLELRKYSILNEPK